MKKRRYRCAQCGLDFAPKSTGNTNKFCSRECYRLWRLQRRGAR